MRNRNLSLMMAVGLMALSGCQKATNDQQSPTNQAALDQAMAFSGLPADKIRLSSASDGLKASYEINGVRFELSYDSSGQIAKVTETSSYAFPREDVRNAALTAAASPAENLVEAVIANDTAAVATAMQELQTSVSQLQSKLEPARFAPLQQVFGSIDAAYKADDLPGVGIAAVDLYRKLQEAKNWDGAPVPLSVSLLDHAGFKAELLASADAPAWSALTAVGQDAANQMDLAASSLSDANLSTVVQGIVTRLRAAIAAQDVDQTKASARQLLAAVDLLEGAYLKAWQGKHPAK